MVLELATLVLVIPIVFLKLDPTFLGKWKYFTFFIEDISEWDVDFLVRILMLSLFALLIIKSATNALFTYVQSKSVRQWALTVEGPLIDSFGQRFYQDKSFEAIKRYVNLTTSIYQSVVMNLIGLFVNLFAVCIITVLLLFIEPFGALITVTVFSIVLICQHYFMAKLSENLGSQLSESKFARDKELNKIVRGFKDIYISGALPQFRRSFLDHENHVFDLEAKQATFNQLPVFISQIIIVASILSMLALVFSYFENPEEILPSFGLIVLVGLRLMPRVNQIQLTWNRILASKRNLTLFQQAIAVSNNPEQTEEIDLQKHKKLEFRKICFEYKRDVPTLKDVDCDISYNDRFVGVVGKTGSGKSTLIDVISGYKKISAGSVLLDGVPLKQFHLKSVSYVGQQFFLFDDSIKNNVLFANQGVFEEPWFNQVLKATQVDRLIELRGKDFTIGEEGRNLSGGERQRVAIARALFNRPDIIVFDESTSAIDMTTEKQIVANIKKMRRDKLTIFVTHRKSLLHIFTRIILVDDGAVVGCNTAESLSTTNSKFQELFDIKGH